MLPPELATTEPRLLFRDGELTVSRCVLDGARFLRLAASSPAGEHWLAGFHGLAPELDVAWAIRPRALVRERGETVLWADEPPGEPLSSVLERPLPLADALGAALGIARALVACHGRGIIHRDLKPTAIWVDLANRRAWLGGAGLALHSRRSLGTDAARTIAGTPAYMAPEQTGRMNRSPDERSDLYAFGVVLYRLLVGELPFDATEPAELVYAHVARRPVPPRERAPQIPAVLSELVMKLLAKLGEDRYQTASAVEADLARCLEQWVPHGRVEDFVLAERDVPARFQAPAKLYGRESVLAELREGFERVAAGGPTELVLVSGYSGVGKSALVGELRAALAPPRARFASGKFDQFQRDIPFATVAQALERLLGMALSGTEAELASYRAAVRAAITPYGALLVELLPDLPRLVGALPAPPEVAPQDAQRVFEQVLARLLGVFARPEQPLVLFLDDLQWLDTATLDLLQHLLVRGEPSGLLLIGAYRDNEVGAEHALSRRVHTIRASGGRVSEIELLPLKVGDVEALVAETLRAPDVAPLARLVFDKTAGNPLFTIQFLSALVEDEWVLFDHAARRWTWDLSRIAGKSFTDNVLGLMLEKMTRLPEPCRRALRVLACLGNRAPLDALAVACESSATELARELEPAVNAGLLLGDGVAVSFLHDRVQEAAYALIPEAERPSVHLGIGRRMLARLSPSEREGAVFELASQLNRGTSLMDASELERAAELNLVAGKRAKASTAYVTALSFLRQGEEQLGAEGAARRPELSFALSFARAECELLTGEHVAAEQRLERLSQRAPGLVELAAVTCLRIMLFVTLGRPGRAVEASLEYLERAGVRFSLTPSPAEARAEYDRMWAALGERSIEELAQLPPMTDPVAQGTLDVLSAVLPPAWFSGPDLPALLTGRMVNISIEHGNCAASAYGYVMVGMKMGPYLGDYRAAYRFGKLGLSLVAGPVPGHVKARVLFTYAMFVRPWTHDLGGGEAMLEEAFALAEQLGDVTFAVYILTGVDTLRLTRGAPLEHTEQAARRAVEHARAVGFEFLALLSEVKLRLARMLRGDSPRFGSLDGEGFDEQRFADLYGAVPEMALPMCWYWIRRQQAHFFAGDAAASCVAAARARDVVWVTGSYLEFAEYHFYGALAVAQQLPQLLQDEQGEARALLAEHLRHMAVFGENSPTTWGSRALLAAAEGARVDGREREAMDLYQRASDSARAHGALHVEALAFELAARFYAARGLALIAVTYFREAHRAYQRWGAFGKAAALEREHPELGAREAPERATTTMNTSVDHLELATVLKVSRAVTGERSTPRLIDSLLRTAMEHAGAERGLLLSFRGGTPWLEAEATTRDAGVVVGPGASPESGAALPQSLVRYVARSQNNVVLDDTRAPHPFSDDPYFVTREVRSLLCFPLVHQAEAVAVLYLENGLTPQSFGASRGAVLTLLASQAAISLENARLYGELAERESRIRRLVDANIIGILMWNLSGEITDANESFLRMVGYDRETLLAGGMRWTDLTPPEWGASDQRAIAELRESGTFRPYEKEFACPDGRRVPVLIGGATFEGNSHEGVAFVLDLSEPRRAERELEQERETLRHARERLSQVSRVTSMGELTASVAHEIKQPMTAALANAGAAQRWLAREPPELAEARAAVARMVKDVQRANGIVGRVGLLFRKSSLPREAVDVNALLREVALLMDPELSRQSVVLELDLEPELPSAVADRIGLQQVVVNLVVNGAEAMHAVEGQRRLRLTSKRGDGQLTVSISDGGVGLPPELDQIFNAFYTTKPDGTGMGLAITRSILDAHGGRIWATRNPEGGATFWFSLPLSPAEPPQNVT